MKIGVDLDDVLGDSTSAFFDFHNEIYGTKLQKGDLKIYNWHNVVGGPKDEFIERVKKFHTTTYGHKTEPLKHSQKILEKLKKNNELFVITARPFSVKEETEKWIKKNFPNIFSKIYFTNQLVDSNVKITKKTICDNLNIDVFIEDSLEYATDCVAPNRTVYLIDKPWNQTDKLPKGIKRINSWKEIEKNHID